MRIFFYLTLIFVILFSVNCGSSSESSPNKENHATGGSQINAAGSGGEGAIMSGASGIYSNISNGGQSGSQIIASGGAAGIIEITGGSSTSDGPGLGGGTTSDPGPSVGGGSTQDPGGVGGGTTEDPGSGGGNTDDPGSGGGSTVDPGVGGGNTDDPGTGGATADPGSGGTTSPGLGGATEDPGTGGTNDPGTGGATADGGTGGYSPPDEDCPWVCVPAAIEGTNLIVLNDAAPSGADVEGRMYVGNNAVLPSGYAVNAVETIVGANEYALVVGNDLTVNGGTVHGAIAFGGEMSGSITATGGIVNASPVDFEQLSNDMLYWSDTLAETPDNGTVSGSLVLTGTDLEVNVFTVDASALAAASGLSITVPDDSTVLINVTGAEVSITNMGFNYIGTDSQHVMFNMPQAETVFMSGISLQGTLLAPRADLTFENGNAEGQVIVYNLVTGGGEYHPYYFTGCPWECI